MPILPETQESLEKGLVQELNLAPYTIEREDMKIIIERLPKNTNMKSMILGSCRFDRDVSEKLCAEIAPHPSLMEIAIGANDEIGDTGARAFADMLATSQKLASLQLNKCNIGDVGARAIARALKNNHTLNILDLSNNKISDAGAQAFAETLRTNKTLVRLRLEGNLIGYHGINALAEALAGNQTLVEFTLLNNKGDDKQMQAVEDAFAKSRNIINLRVNKKTVIPVCHENKQTAMRMFEKLNSHDIADLPKEDVSEMKTRLYSLMYVAEHDMCIPRYRILELMSCFKKFINSDMATA
ncbi:MAG: hypothetical protein AB7L92_07550 [Alphaproteobacteria bacterium]